MRPSAFSALQHQFARARFRARAFLLLLHEAGGAREPRQRFPNVYPQRWGLPELLLSFTLTQRRGGEEREKRGGLSTGYPQAIHRVANCFSTGEFQCAQSSVLRFPRARVRISSSATFAAPRAPMSPPRRCEVATASSTPWRASLLSPLGKLKAGRWSLSSAGTFAALSLFRVVSASGAA